ncbi:PAS domain S-box protein [Haloplanus salilacus]|uniref:PAS domain S-box protein n=1 Tax=Haloplanus salilacus TaxID=2949994 RepID=UPI0030D446D2
MEDRSAESVERSPADERILLIANPGQDRTLLRDWLDSLSRYRVVVRDPGGSLPDPDSYDLCLLDDAALARSADELLGHRAESDPVFLPCLLVTTARDAVGDHFAVEDDDGRSLVDDIVPLPVEQSLLSRRIENLLHARRAATRLREREQQYERLVNLTPEALLVLRDHEIVYSNAAAADTFAGGDDADLQGRSVTTLVPDDALDRFTETLRDIDRDGRVEGFRSVRMRTTAGDHVRTKVAGTRVVFGEEPATQLLVRDVTAEHEREQRLSLFGRAIQSAAQGVTIADARREDTPLVYANSAFEEITGYSQAEALGRNCRFLQGSRTADEPVARMRRAIDTGTPVTVEVLNYRKDGTAFWNQVDLLPVTDDDGTVTHFLGLQRDITRRKSREERLQVLDRVLRHNLRNRMNVIIGHAERLQSDDDPAVVETAETIERAGQSLLSISEQITEFEGLISRSDQGPTVYDLASALERVVAGVRAEHPAATVRLDSPESATIRGSRLLPAALEEVLELAVRPGPADADVELVVRVGGDRVCLDLIDHGRTIPESDFEVIARESESSTEHPDGLEFWLVRWAVLNSNGDMDADPVDDRRFSIRLPRGGDETDRATER